METRNSGEAGDGSTDPSSATARVDADLELDLASGAIAPSPRLNLLLGYPETRPLTIDEFHARVHPDDAPGLRAFAQAGGSLTREFRVLLPDGRVRWLHARGEAPVERSGVPVRVRIALQEITERKRSEAAARESEDRYRALAATSPVAILVNCGGACVYANDAAARLLHAGSPRELIGRTPLELVAPDYRELAMLRFSQVLERRDTLPRVRYRWRRLDGGEVDVDVAAAWVQWQGEDAVQIVAHDITAEILVEEALRQSRALLADQLEDATRLQNVSARLIEADDAGAIYRHLLSEAVRLMRAVGGSVRQLDATDGRLHVVAAEGLPPGIPHISSGVAGGWSPPAQALSERRRVVVDDLAAVDATGEALDLYRRAGIRAVQSTPLIARDGTVVGVMSTHWNEPYRPAERELRLLDVLARQAADLLERHRAQERLAAIERRQSFLLKLTDELREARDPPEARWRACRLLGEHLAADRVHCGEHDARAARVVVVSDWFRTGLRSHGGAYPLASFGATPMGLGADDGSLAVADTANGAHLSQSARVTCHALGVGAFVTTPVRRGGQVAWALSVVCERPHAWTADEIRLIEEVADRIDAALDRARAERALKESRAVLQAFYDSSPLMMGIVEIRGDAIVTMEMNDAAARFFRVPTGTAGAATGGPALPAAAAAAWLAHYRRAQYRAQPARFEYEHDGPDGPRWVTAIVVHLGTAPESRSRFSFVAEDVTERKRVEELARESEARRIFLLSLDEALQPLASAAEVLREACRVVRRTLGVDRVLYAVAASDDRYTVVAADTTRIGGADLADLELAQYAPRQHGDLRAGHVAAGERAVAHNGGTAQAWRSVEAIDAPLVRQGALVALMSAQCHGMRTWTPAEFTLLAEAAERTWAAAQRAGAHAALRDSEDRYRSLIDSVRDYAIFMLDTDGRVVEWTDGAASVFGYPAQEVLGRPASMFHTPEDAATGAPQAELEEAERVGRAEREAWRVCKGGRRIWANEVVTEVRGADGGLRGYIKISRNLTERRRVEQALADAARHKDDFLAMLSHELRNPLAPIRNSVYVLRHVRGESEAARHAQGVIERQTQHLARLVDDLLDVTRISRGRIELRHDRVELRDLVRRAGEDFRAVLEDRHIGFAVELPEERVWCLGDATRLNQAIGNLLTNAAKFTVDGDQVELSLRVVDGAARIRVADSGAGIDPELLPHLFDPFVQGQRTRARSEGGLGLGLALVKGIIELHGGEVAGESDGCDCGAAFTLTLPIGPAAAARPVAEPVAAPDRRCLHVLIVDDNTDAADTLAAMLQLQGHIVEVAYDGHGALAKVRAAPPDVVLCDIGLPRMSGYEVARAVRGLPNFEGRLVAVSGYAQPDDIRRCLEAGFDAHLAKPYDPERLERLLG